MQNGIIHTIATALIAYAMTMIKTNIWQGIAVGLIGVALYLGKEYLISKGWNISGKK